MVLCLLRVVCDFGLCILVDTWTLVESVGFVVCLVLCCVVNSVVYFNSLFKWWVWVGCFVGGFQLLCFLDLRFCVFCCAGCDCVDCWVCWVVVVCLCLAWFGGWLVIG